MRRKHRGVSCAVLALAGAVALTLGFAAPCSAALITSSTADFEPRLRTGPAAPTFDPGPSTTAVNARVGFQANFNIGAAFFFHLPVLGPGESITAADFSVTELADTASTAITPTHNADLFALGFTNAAPPANTITESQAYYYVGPEAGDAAPGHVLLQNNFLAPSDFIPLGGVAALKSTNAAGDAALVAYINSLYANQGTNGFIPGASSLILRVNPDALTGAGTNRYSLATADNITAGIQKPTLDLTAAVPEPTTMALAAMAGLVALGARLRLAKTARAIES